MRLPDKEEYLLGVISDTHGLVRPETISVLQGVDVIIHAGDVGGEHVLPPLAEIAPVVAVRGNIDTGRWGGELPDTAVVEAGPILLYVLHDLGTLDLDPAAAGFHVVISGHSHQPSIARRGEILYLNPGSVGPRRFRLPVSLALLRLRGRYSDPRLLELSV